MRVPKEELHAAARELRAAARDLFNDVRALRFEAEAVMSGSWVGVASSSHATEWSAWCDAAATLAVALNRDALVLDVAANEFESADEDFTYTLRATA